MQKRNGPSNPQNYQERRILLNEKQWRQYLAIEARKRGSVTEVAKSAGVSRNTVKRGLQELEAGDLYRPGERLRKTGGGIKKERTRCNAASCDHKGPPLREPKAGDHKGPPHAAPPASPPTGNVIHPLARVNEPSSRSDLHRWTAHSSRQLSNCEHHQQVW